MSNYRFPITDAISIRRSRHTGTWGVYEKNPVYGYEAALQYMGEVLFLHDIAAVAQRYGVADEAQRRAVEIVKEGNSAMRPRLDFGDTCETQKI